MFKKNMQRTELYGEDFAIKNQNGCLSVYLQSFTMCICGSSWFLLGEILVLYMFM